MPKGEIDVRGGYRRDGRWRGRKKFLILSPLPFVRDVCEEIAPMEGGGEGRREVIKRGGAEKALIDETISNFEKKFPET